MSKLSFDALSQRADAIAKEELLISINGGTQNCCHPGDCPPPPTNDRVKDNIPTWPEPIIILKE